jgi:hypothetical protein
MKTSADVSKFKIVPVQSKCWTLLKPVLGGVDVSLHLTVPSMNRLNQTEPATFSTMPCLAFFRDSYFLQFTNICFNHSTYVKIECLKLYAFLICLFVFTATLSYVLAIALLPGQPSFSASGRLLIYLTWFLNEWQETNDHQKIMPCMRIERAIPVALPCL